MDYFRGAVATLLLTAVCALLFRFLLPEGGVSRTAKTVVSLVTLCAVCAPLLGLWGKLSGETAFSSGLSAYMEARTTFPYETMERQAAQAVRDACEGILSEYTDAPHDIEVDMHIPEGGGIEIKRIRIVLESEPERLEEMKAELTECCGFAPEVRVKTDDG